MFLTSNTACLTKVNEGRSHFDTAHWGSRFQAGQLLQDAELSMARQGKRVAGAALFFCLFFLFFLLVAKIPYRYLVCGLFLGGTQFCPGHVGTCCFLQPPVFVPEETGPEVLPQKQTPGLLDLPLGWFEPLPTTALREALLYSLQPSC